MTRLVRLTACSLAAGLLAIPCDLRAATVKLKEGRTLEGDIQGYVVQREMDPKVRNAAWYSVSKGADVTAIDEQGVHVAPGSDALFGKTTEQRRPLDDVEVLQLLVAPPKGFGMPKTRGGATLLRFGPAPRREGDVVSGTPLLGTFRIDQDKGQLSPSLEVLTSTGPIVVQITEVVAFTPSGK